MEDDLIFDSPAEATGQRQATNLGVAPTQCLTCGGDRFVVVATRAPVASAWMKERGLEPKGEIEEMAPCPSCNAIEVEHRRVDGTLVRSVDPARARQMMDS